MSWFKDKLRNWLMSDDSSIKKASRLRAGNAIPTIEEDHESMSSDPVSYTHLTLPTNREV